ncbi:MAG: type II toxin-antitoxin system VapC family toxin [Geminicoccaceae bacterium]
MRSAIVVDPSGALKWVLDEDDSHLARALAGRNLAAPDLLWSECANGLWRWVVRGVLPGHVAHERFAALRRAPVALTPAGELLERALTLAIELGHPIYDCVYLALALTLGMPVVSADRRFVNVVRRHAALSVAVVLLAETAH